MIRLSNIEIKEMRKEEKERRKDIISIESFGNKKEMILKEGKLYLSESQIKEYKEMEIIKSGDRGDYIEEIGGRKIPIHKGEIENSYQFHQKRKSSYKIISEKKDDINYRMILFPKKDFDRIEIWKFPKGGKREMILRDDKKDFIRIENFWNDIFSDNQISNLSEIIDKMIG